jgi:hypothetical protein
VTTEARSARAAEADPHKVLELLLARLRQLSLIRLDAVIAGVGAADRDALAAALADDLEHALGEAHEHAARILAALGRGPGPLAVARSVARRSADPATRQRWRAQLASRARLARDLHRLWAAAAAVLPVLEDADRAR